MEELPKWSSNIYEKFTSGRLVSFNPCSQREIHKENIKTIKSKAQSSTSTSLRSQAHFEFQERRNLWVATDTQQNPKIKRLTPQATSKIKFIIHNDLTLDIYRGYLCSAKNNPKQRQCPKTIAMVYFANESAVWMGPGVGGWGVTHLCSPVSGSFIGMPSSGRRLAGQASHSTHGQLGLSSFNKVASGQSGFLCGGSELQEQVFQGTWAEAVRFFYDTALEVPEHHFYHILLVKQTTECSLDPRGGEFNSPSQWEKSQKIYICL